MTPITFTSPMIAALQRGDKTQTRRILKGVQPQYVGVEYMEFIPKLPHAIGDTLWVREQWGTTNDYDNTRPSDLPRDCTIFYQPKRRWGSIDPFQAKVRHNVHMPKWASRTTLLVTDVRVQRIQDISEADAIAEGILPTNPLTTQPFVRWQDYSGEAVYFAAPENSFRTLWNSIHGPDAWARNDWVTATSFERI